jgi:hypothetical protein
MVIIRDLFTDASTHWIRNFDIMSSSSNLITLHLHYGKKFIQVVAVLRNSPLPPIKEYIKIKTCTVIPFLALFLQRSQDFPSIKGF